MSPEDAGSVTCWIELLKAADATAASALWRRYFERLVRLARRRLGAGRRGAADEEDVALSALNSFLAGAAAGRYPHLDNRDDLWRILVTITARKAYDQAHRERRQKRGGGRVAAESELGEPGAEGGDLDGFACPEPTPAFAALLADECRRRLDGLRDEPLRRVALLKMEGYTDAEVAARLDCGLRTVTRKLELIRKAWRQGDPR